MGWFDDLMGDIADLGGDIAEGIGDIVEAVGEGIEDIGGWVSTSLIAPAAAALETVAGDLGSALGITGAASVITTGIDWASGLWSTNKSYADALGDAKDDITKWQEILGDAWEAGERAVEQAVDTLEQDEEFAESTYELTAGQAEETHTFNIKAAEQRFWELVDESVGDQGETRRKANQQILGRAMQGEITRGEAASQLAKSNVRKTGSASSLIGENMRMLNIDLEEMDKQLSSEMSKYGRQRDRFRGDKRRAGQASKLQMGQTLESAGLARDQGIKGARLGFEHGLENVVGGDLDLTAYFAGDQSLIDLLGGEYWMRDTLLTEPVNRELAGAWDTFNEISDTPQYQIFLEGIFN